SRAATTVPGNSYAAVDCCASAACVARQATAATNMVRMSDLMTLPHDEDFGTKDHRGSTPPKVRSWLTRPSAPAEARRDMGQDGLEDVGVVVDAELVRHCEQQRVRLGNGLVLLQLLDQDVRLRGIAAAEYGKPLRFDVAEVVRTLAAPEIGAVALVDQRE